MTAEEYMMENMQGADFQEIESALIGFATLKCQELLEIVAEKARLIEDGYEQYEEYHLNLGGSLRVDKDSILSAVDLDKFIV